MLNSDHRPVRELGSFLFALLMLSSIRRPKWFLNRGRIPATVIGDRDPMPPDQSDLELCQRLIDAYALASEGGGPDGMWSWIFDMRQQELAARLQRRDPDGLAHLLSRMFQQDFVLGMAPGPLLQQARSSIASRAWGLKCLDGLASLGEVLGVAPVETPEQGDAGLAFTKGLPSFLAAIDEKLGFRLDFPEIGAASGLAVEERLITPDTPDQIYAALRLEAALSLHLPGKVLGDADSRVAASVVEIGGGYGGMCLWFLKRCPETVGYTIIDLPIVNTIQGYFLAKALGPEEVAFLGEDHQAPVRILPNSSLDAVETPFDALVNKDSMPEMPRTAMEDYLRWGAEHCRGIFYSYNQEAGMQFLGEPQGIVHESISRLGGFQRLRRDRAWVRDGYVEEVYESVGSS